MQAHDEYGGVISLEGEKVRNIHTPPWEFILAGS
jgi:hypothetical protein